MNSIDQRYKVLLQKILNEGVRKQTRNGEVLSIFSHQIRHSMVEGFPLLTTKKMHWKSIVTELCWFLAGRTDLKYLLDHDVHIWDGDAYQAYLQKETARTERTGQTWTPLSKEEFINKIKTDDEFARKFGDLGPIYGKQWRSWTKLEPNTGQSGYNKTYLFTGFNGIHSHYLTQVDQIANLISELKTNPDSRRLLVSAWNVGELGQMTLPPCHYGFQVYTRELSFDERLKLVNYDKERFNSIDEWISWYKNEPSGYYMGIDYSKDTELTDLGVPTRAISLMWNQRSVDVPLGLPFNIASYGLLLEIIAKAVNMVPEELIGNLGDCHIYSNQIDGVKEQLTRSAFKLPKLNINTEWWPTESGECGVGPIDALAVVSSFSDDNFCRCLLEEDIQLVDYKSHPPIKMPLSN